MNKYDLVIIGSGPAGYTAAFEARKFNLKTAIVERDPERLGGVCLNEGCIPLKGLIYHAHAGMAYQALRELVMTRVAQIRTGLRARIQSLGIETIRGDASFRSNTEIIAGGEAVSAQHFIIATGSTPKRIFDLPNVYPSDRIFNLEKAPGSALIIGGGVVGCEYASFLASVGSQVDLVEMLDSPLLGEDEEAVRVMLREFKKRKINVYAKSGISVISPDGEATIQADAPMTKKYDVIFETTGRRPNTASLSCGAAGIAVDDKGFITVDRALRTTAANIYAAGDCIDTPMLAYTAAREAEAAVRHLATGKAPHIDYAAMPRLVFSSPQVGSAGMGKKEADGKNIDCRVYRYFFKALGKAVMEGKDTGFVKLVAESSTGRVIGASAVGEDIAEIMNQLALIVARGIRTDEIEECMFVHPSYSEIILEAVRYGKQ